MSWLEKCSKVNLPPETQARFEQLAQAQRGEPEGVMLKIQNAQISQLYGWLCEHIGDLTHRMSEKIDWMQGGYEYVKEKVEKTLRFLNNSPDINNMMDAEEDLLGQIHNNIKYHNESLGGNKEFFKTYDTALNELKRLGKEYANAHRNLPTFNAVQKMAQNAAVALGEFNFALVRQNLNALKKILDQGKLIWSQNALKLS